MPCPIDPVSPSIFMMRDSGGDEPEDVGWRNVEEAPIGVERGESVRAILETETVTISEGECVQIPRGAPAPGLLHLTLLRGTT